MSISGKIGNSEILTCAIIYDTHVLVSPRCRHLVIITGTICYNSKVVTDEIEICFFWGKNLNAEKFSLSFAEFSSQFPIHISCNNLD